MTLTHWTPATPEQISAHHALTESIDPAFAQREREFYASRSVGVLNAMAADAWRNNEGDRWALAMGYAKIASGQ